jgi:integrase
MPKTAAELSAVAVRRLNHQGFFAVGGVAGLHLQIGASGARSWILRVKIGSKRRDIGLGGYPDVGLALAREKARELRAQIQSGVDPVASRIERRTAIKVEQSKLITFDSCTEKFLQFKVKEFRNQKHAAQWFSTLTRYASPLIGGLPVSQIELHHIVSILEPMWFEKTETATRVRGRIESVLSWATVSGYRGGENPARWRGNLDAVLPRPEKIRSVRHHAAVRWQDMTDFILALGKRRGVAARALEFLIYTAARSNEVRGMVWSEVDLESGCWTVPAERMKTNRQHVVPLCASALACLRVIPKLSDSDFVFPGARTGMISETAVMKHVKSISPLATIHGFRSSFKDWAAESTVHSEYVVEMALAHAIPNGVERAYRRGNLLEKRFVLMDQWDDFLNQNST